MNATSQLSLEALHLQQSMHQQSWYNAHQQPQQQQQQQHHQQQQQLQQQQQQALLQQYVARNQRWILFMRHCCQCRDEEPACLYSANCTLGRQLWEHILSCSNAHCAYPRCGRSRLLLKHHQKCQAGGCPVCVPVKDYLHQVRQQQQSTKSLLEPSAINDDIQAVPIFPSEFDALLQQP